MKTLQKLLKTILALGACVMSDQFIKILVRSLIAPGGSLKVTSFLTLIYAWNPGISFGLFPCKSVIAKHALLVLICFLIFFLMVWYWRTNSSLQRVALISIIGGALSNAYDRFKFDAVFDFLYFHWGEGRGFPAFNLADTLISIGFLLLITENFQWKFLKFTKKLP